jgi:hypothetical protein
VYTAAITKAGQRKQTSQLGNAFAAAAVELDAATGDASKLLNPLVTATARTITVSGCRQALPFVKGEQLQEEWCQVYEYDIFHKLLWVASDTWAGEGDV